MVKAQRIEIEVSRHGRVKLCADSVGADVEDPNSVEWWKKRDRILMQSIPLVIEVYDPYVNDAQCLELIKHHPALCAKVIIDESIESTDAAGLTDPFGKELNKAICDAVAKMWLDLNEPGRD